jgi:enoyl-CoA hydratase/carnithine racemase
VEDHFDVARIMSPSDALAVVRDTFELGSSDDSSSWPVLVVALEQGAELATLNEIAPSLPCVLVGISDRQGDDVPEGFDVLLSTLPKVSSPWVQCSDVSTTAAELIDRILRSPLAAVSLVQILRLGSSLSVFDAVVAESFVYSMLQSGPTYRDWLASRQMTASGDQDPNLEPDPILVSRKGSHMEIELNRPRVRNALNAAMRDALLAALQIVLLDPSIRTVKLTGRGPAFCSGGDLTEFGLADDPATAHRVRIRHSIGALLSRCADRVEVHLHGSCVGAGIEIPAFSRRVVGGRAAAFSLPEVGFGLIPGAGGTASIPRRIGRQRTAFLAISGTSVTATTAQAWGLVDEVVERPDDLGPG